MKQGWLTSKDAQSPDNLWPWHTRGSAVAGSIVQRRIIGVIRAGRAGPYRRRTGEDTMSRYGRTDDVGRGEASLRLRGR